MEPQVARIWGPRSKSSGVEEEVEEEEVVVVVVELAMVMMAECRSCCFFLWSLSTHQ